MKTMATKPLTRLGRLKRKLRAWNYKRTLIGDEQLRRTVEAAREAKRETYELTPDWKFERRIAK